MVTPAVT